jgi:hypothetical protein
VKILGLFALSCWPLLSLPAFSQPALPPDPTPKDVRDLIRATADALTNKDTRDFLGRFDAKMPGYETLNYYVEALAARDVILSSIEIYTDQGDDRQRTMELDWILNVDSERARRAFVKVRIEKQGKKWKFVSLEPVDFFKPPPS